MLPQKHLTYGILLSLFLAFILPDIVGFTGVMIIILSTVLLDGDHYVNYILSQGDINILNTYRFFRSNHKKFKALPINKRAEYYWAWCFLHGIEVLIIALLLTVLVSEYFGFAFIGLAFHLILDYSEQWPFLRRKDKISIVHDFLKFRKLKNING